MGLNSNIKPIEDNNPKAQNADKRFMQEIDQCIWIR